MSRIILIDANVFDQIQRGNAAVANAFLAVYRSGAKIYVAQQAYTEMLDEGASQAPGYKRAIAANREFLKDFKIEPAPPGNKSVYMATIAENAKGKAGLGMIGDARVAAHAKAIGAEVFSPDKGFAKNWRSVQQQLGVTVAAEVRNIQALPKGSVQDFKVGRRLLGLPDIDIDANGVVTRGMVVPSGSKVGRPVMTAQGTIQSGQRGMVVPSGSNVGRPATTAQGTIQSGQRGMVVPSGSNVGRPVTTTQGTIQSGSRGGGGGGGSAGAVAGGVLNVVITLAIPVIKAYFAKHLQAKWKKEEQDRLEALLFYYMPAMNGEIISRSEEIRREKANGKKAYVRVQTHAEFTPTDMGPAMTKLEMLGFHVFFEGDETMDFSYLETHQGFAARAGKSYVTHQRETHLIPI